MTAAIQQKEVTTATNTLKKMGLPPHYTVILYITKSSHSFPINLLRNIAIRSIQTSHFLVMDADMRPSGMNNNYLLYPWSLDLFLSSSLPLFHSFIADLYQELHRLPQSIQKDKKAAVIIPAVFLKQKNEILNKCNSLHSCEIELCFPFPLYE